MDLCAQVALQLPHVTTRGSHTSAPPGEVLAVTQAAEHDEGHCRTIYRPASSSRTGQGSQKGPLEAAKGPRRVIILLFARMAVHEPLSPSAGVI